VQSVFDKIPLLTLLNGGLDVKFVQISTPHRTGNKPPGVLPTMIQR
jgi:hypothetical protein